MCSVIAAAGEWDIETIEKILFYSRIRGLHSFGYSFVENKTIKTKFNTEPYLIHDNSSFSLNLIKKI